MPYPFAKTDSCLDTVGTNMFVSCERQVASADSDGWVIGPFGGLIRSDFLAEAQQAFRQGARPWNPLG